MKHITHTLRTLLYLVFAAWHGTIAAQTDRIYSPSIASLQAVADDNWLSMPVMQLGSGSVMNISFDDLTHEYHRYAYRLEHCG